MKNLKGFKVIDNSAKVLSEARYQFERGLDAIGLQAEKYAKQECPVDTGRLRNSITYLTTTSQGKPNTSTGARAKDKDYRPFGKAEKGAVYIGTNVEYAQAMELTDMEHKTGRAHFLRDAASAHGKEYKELMKKSMKR